MLRRRVVGVQRLREEIKQQEQRQRWIDEVTAALQHDPRSRWSPRSSNLSRSSLLFPALSQEESEQVRDFLNPAPSDKRILPRPALPFTIDNVAPAGCFAIESPPSAI